MSKPTATELARAVREMRRKMDWVEPNETWGVHNDAVKAYAVKVDAMLAAILDQPAEPASGTVAEMRTYAQEELCDIVKDETVLRWADELEQAQRDRDSKKRLNDKLTDECLKLTEACNEQIEQRAQAWARSEIWRKIAEERALHLEAANRRIVELEGRFTQLVKAVVIDRENGDVHGFACERDAVNMNIKLGATKGATYISVSGSNKWHYHPSTKPEGSDGEETANSAG